MRKLFVFIIAVMFTALTSMAQIDDAKRISISAVQPEYDNIPEAARANLETKMQRIISASGLGSNADTRFILTAKVDVIDKGVTTSGMILQKMEVTFIIGDVIEEKIYGTNTVNIAGVGETEVKAYIKAFQNIRPMNEFFMTAKDAIVDYYTNSCQTIITDANRMAKMQQYDDAITNLVTVPNVCEDCYNTCQDRAIEIYNEKVEVEVEANRAAVDNEGLVLIKQARSAWMARQDYESAQKAMDLLAGVDPNASCSKDADALVDEISAKLRADEAKAEAKQEAREKAEAERAKAEWEFKVRQYEDKNALDWQKQADKAAVLGTLANRFGRIDIGIKKEKAFKFGSSSK